MSEKGGGEGGERERESGKRTTEPLIAENMSLLSAKSLKYHEKPVYNSKEGELRGGTQRGEGGTTEREGEGEHK